jgi:hypothetical protein
MVTKASRSRKGVTNIPLIWRLRLVLHGVRLSPFAHDDLTTTQGARLIAYRVQMIDSDLIGADTAPIDARVNIRAASFVLRHFGLQAAELRTDARGALLALEARSTEFKTRRPMSAAAGARSGTAASASAGAALRN